MDTSKFQGHTPGPWATQHLGGGFHGYAEWNTYAVRRPDNVCIAEVGHVDRLGSECNEANARLIAAAPALLSEVGRLRAINAELVAALRDAVFALETMASHASETYPHFEDTRGQVDIARSHDALEMSRVALAKVQEASK